MTNDISVILREMPMSVKGFDSPQPLYEKRINTVFLQSCG